MLPRKFDWNDPSYYGEVTNRIAELIEWEVRGKSWVDKRTGEATDYCAPHVRWEYDFPHFAPVDDAMDALFAARLAAERRRAPFRLDCDIHGNWQASFGLVGQARQVLATDSNPPIAICKALLGLANEPNRTKQFSSNLGRHSGADRDS